MPHPVPEERSTTILSRTGVCPEVGHHPKSDTQPVRQMNDSSHNLLQTEEWCVGEHTGHPLSREPSLPDSYQQHGKFSLLPTQHPHF